MQNNEITILPTETVFYREFDTRIKLIKLPRKFHFNYARAAYHAVGPMHTFSVLTNLSKFRRK